MGGLIVNLRRLKIEIICVNDKYGKGVHTRNLIKKLSEKPEIELHVVNVINTEEQKMKRFGNFSLHYIDHRGKNSLVREILNFRDIIRKTFEIDPNIIHIQYLPLLALPTLLLKRKYPCICTLHSLYYRDERNFGWTGIRHYIIRKVLSFLERKIIFKNLYLILVSPQTRNILPKGADRGKTFVVPNGIDLATLKDVKGKAVKHPSILYVGRLTKRKGVDVLLKAFSIVRKEISNAMLYLIGSGEQENELKSLAEELKIEASVKFLGYIPEKEKYSYYKSVDLCVVPSIDFDYFPIVSLEAMAFRKPVVASHVGGIPFVVENGKTGLLAEPGNSKDLADKIIMLLKDKELREQMGRRGYERAKKFTWDKVAEQTINVYREVMKSYEDEHS